MKIEINGLHFTALAITIFLWIVWLPTWPSLFVLILGQVAATYITRSLEQIIGDGKP